MTTTPATTILNKVYVRHLIKVARGQSYASNPGGNTPRVSTGSSPAPTRSFSAPGARGSAPTSTLRPPAQNTNQPSVAGAFFSGMGQGAKNMASSTMNFFPAMANFAIPTVAGAVSQLSPHADIRALGQDWLQQGMAGAKDMAGNVGNFLGVSDAPQNLAQHRQMMQQKYFSNPQDKGLSLAYDGVNRAADVAAQTIPAALTGQLAVAGASKIPAVANAGNAVKTMIEGNRVLNPVLKTTSVATGMPLHPAALPGGSLAGAAGSAQFAQQLALGAGVAGSEYLPANATDSTMRQLHPRAPELIDAVALPGAAKAVAPLEALVNASEPAQEYTAQQQQQLAQQQSQQAAPGQAADNYYGNRIQELVTGNAPSAELNSTFDEYLQRAGQNMPKEEYAQIQQNVTQTREQLGQLSPEGKQRVGEAITKPDSKAGQEVAAKGLENHIQANAAAAPQNPQDFGGWMNQMVTQFQSMDPMSQIGMGLGLGAGVLGLLSGLGGGGIGSFLLGALGLGAAGFMGANAGMFGEGGQNLADDLKFNVGSMLGMIPEVKRDDLAPLLTKDPMAALSKQAPKIDYASAAMDPEGYAKTVAPQIQQAEAQLGKLEQLAGQTPYMLMKVSPGLSAEEAQLAITNAKAVLADAKNPQGQLGSQLALAREFMADPVAVRNREAGNMLGTGLANAGNFISGLWKGSSDMNIAQQIIIEQLITKAARCWAGYEPVPGKKPYSNDSCRPVGSKKKKKKKAEKTK